MPIVTHKLGALTGFSASTNLSALPNTQAKPLGEVSNVSLKYPNAFVKISVTATADLAYDGNIDLYFIPCLNDVWTDGINPDTSSDVAASLLTAERIIPTTNVAFDQSSQKITWVFNDLAAKVGDLPEKWTIVVLNNTGQNFKSSGYSAVYKPRSYQV